MWKKVLGWILFGYGVLGAIYTLATASLVALFPQLLLAALFIWGGWKLAHRKKVE